MQNNVKNVPDGKDIEGLLESQCLNCKDCSPDLDSTSVIKRSKTRPTSEIVETERILTVGEACVSMASITISEKADISAHAPMSLWVGGIYLYLCFIDNKFSWKLCAVLAFSSASMFAIFE